MTVDDAIRAYVIQRTIDQALPASDGWTRTYRGGYRTWTRPTPSGVVRVVLDRGDLRPGAWRISAPGLTPRARQWRGPYVDSVSRGLSRLECAQ